METETLIFFDLDGTLFDNNVRWYQIHLNLSKDLKFNPLPKEEYIGLKKSAVKEEKIMKKRGVKIEDISNYVRKRIEVIEDMKYLKEDKVKPGVYELLSRLKDSYYLVLVTKRTNKENCLKQLEWTDLKKYFKQIKIAEGVSKDRLINEVLSSRRNSKSIFVGDTKDDLVASRKSNIKCILVCDGVRDREYLSRLNPDYLFETINEIVIPESF